MSIYWRCVIDANVGIKQFIVDPLTPKVNQLFKLLERPDTIILVPDLFYIESANILWKYVRHQLYDRYQIEQDLVSLKDFRLRVVSTADLMVNAVNIALQYGISTYDGSYVALSQRVGAPLLTLDQKLLRNLAGSTYDIRDFANFDLPDLIT